VSLLASGCNVVLVSDACAQLRLEPAPVPGLKGLKTSTLRFVDTLMERVRLANFADLEARRRSGLLRGLAFLHMKAGLDADVIRLAFSQEAYGLERIPLSPSGVRKDFQGSGGDADRSRCIHARRSVWPDGMWLSNGVKRPRPRTAKAPEGVASSASRRLAVPGDARRDNVSCKHDGTS
jgi:hypothetical protein